ncbi:MAG: acyltransferase [Legionellales bacterium]|nr:acyltransferase [Legionellales bacterium]
MRRIDYLDGLRGIACLVVFLSHFMGFYYPASLTGEIAQVHSSWDLFWIRTPFNFFFNGSFAIAVFFILSGFVLSAPFFHDDKRSEPLISIIKRLPRLGIPIIGSIVLAFVLIHAHGYYSNQASVITHSRWSAVALLTIPHFKDLITAPILTLFTPTFPDYNAPLWTMPIEFYGSLLTFLLLACFRYKEWRWLLYLFCIVGFYQTYLPLFTLGVCLNDLQNHYPTLLPQLFSRITRPFFLLIVFILGAYPFHLVPHSVYRYIHYSDFDYSTWHMIAAFLLLGCLIESPRLQAFFTHRFVLFFGYISFSFYLFHYIVFLSLGSFVFVSLIDHTSYWIAAWSSGIISFIVVIPLSLLMTKILDQPAVHISQKCAQYLRRWQ